REGSVLSLAALDIWRATQLVPKSAQGGVAGHLLLNPGELRSQGAASLDLGWRRPVQGAGHTEDTRYVARSGIGSRGMPKSLTYSIHLGDKRAVLRIKDIEGLPGDAWNLRGLEDA